MAFTSTCTTRLKHCCGIKTNSQIETDLTDSFSFPLQDNAPHHTAKTVQKQLEEQNKGLKVLTWPPNSPNPNPI